MDNPLKQTEPGDRKRRNLPTLLSKPKRVLQRELSVISIINININILKKRLGN